MSNEHGHCTALEKRAVFSQASGKENARECSVNNNGPELLTQITRVVANDEKLVADGARAALFALLYDERWITRNSKPFPDLFLTG